MFACILLLSAGLLLVFAAKPLLAYVQPPRRSCTTSTCIARSSPAEVPHDQPFVAASASSRTASSVLSVLLLLVWLLLVDSFAIGHWLLGAFLGVCIPLLTNRLLVGRSQEWHPLLLLKLLVLVMWDILVANIQVARLTLGPIERLRPAFVEVPIELENDLAISVLVSIVSLTPGSVSSDLSDDRKTLLVHGLDVPDKAALIAEIKQRYEAPLKEIFPCSLT